jgi:hypothetical protein
MALAFLHEIALVIFLQKDADHYEELPRIPSASGAKTGLPVPELNRLYVAVSPGERKTGAAVQFAVVAGDANPPKYGGEKRTLQPPGTPPQTPHSP